LPRLSITITINVTVTITITEKSISLKSDKRRNRSAWARKRLKLKGLGKISKNLEDINDTIKEIWSKPKEIWIATKEEVGETDFEEPRRSLLNSYHSYVQTHAGYIIALTIGVVHDNFRFSQKWFLADSDCCFYWFDSRNLNSDCIHVSKDSLLDNPCKCCYNYPNG
jgi:hypothetical protein